MSLNDVDLDLANSLELIDLSQGVDPEKAAGISELQKN